jgi:hypothetical protein
MERNARLSDGFNPSGQNAPARGTKVKKIFVKFLFTILKNGSGRDRIPLHNSASRVIKGTPKTSQKGPFGVLQTPINRIVMPPAGVGAVTRC